MNNVDKQYLDLLRDIIEHGAEKDTRSGRVRSVFGRTMRFDLSEGLPLLTTKKVYYKGIIHELLWFLKGDTNIKYLVDNNVHIWTDDALRWFRSLDLYSLKRSWFGYDEDIKEDYQEEEIFYHGGYILMEMQYLTQNYYIIFPETKEKIKIIPEHFQKNVTKELFEEYVTERAYIERCDVYEGKERNSKIIYHFGDLGPVYGKQWRKFGVSETDQIQKIIETLKTNPDDRRMILTGWNPDVLGEVALPACHIFANFWTRKLTDEERIGLFYKQYQIGEEVFNPQPNQNHSFEYQLFKEYFHYETLSKDKFIEIINDKYNIPSRELSCSFTMRSNDYCSGWSFNVVSYSILTYILCNICNMKPGEIIYNGMDIHVYENHIEKAKEQLKRMGCEDLPEFIIKRQLKGVDDLVFEDFDVINYKSDPPIKFQLNVG